MTNLNEELEMNGDLELGTDETTEKVARKKSLIEEKIIQINDNFRYIIHTDDNLQLQRKKKYDDGTEDFVFYGWFGDMYSMARKFIKINTIENTRDASVEHMEQLVKIDKDSVDLILNHIKESKKG
jgi:hypothetical protein